MTFPGIVFGVVLSTLYGTAFHLWKDGSLNRLILFVILSWLGFWAGHLIGGLIGWTFAAAGPINAGMGTLGSAVFLFVGEWLSRVELSKK